MNNYALIIMFLFPNAIPLTDFTIVNNGISEVISYWNVSKLGPVPTLDFLESKRKDWQKDVDDKALKAGLIKTDKAEIKLLVTDLSSGKGTTLERLARIERSIVTLINNTL